MEGATQDTVPAGTQAAEVERVTAVVMQAIQQDVQALAELMVGKKDDQLFGRTEFEFRDKILVLARHALEATVNDRKKRGTKAAAGVAPSVTRMPDLWAGGRRLS